jgi:hypothetical protein
MVILVLLVVDLFELSVNVVDLFELSVVDLFELSLNAVWLTLVLERLTVLLLPFMPVEPSPNVMLLSVCVVLLVLLVLVVVFACVSSPPNKSLKNPTTYPLFSNHKASRPAKIYSVGMLPNPLPLFIFAGVSFFALAVAACDPVL